jgi:NAD-dependent dihydropyrimidine dehydrogenase PreA subunit
MSGSPEERGLFIQVDVAQGCTHGEGCRLCIDACPVDIFAAAAHGVVDVQPKLEDECILCGLCVDRCPPGVIRIIKLYDEVTA